MSRIHTAAQQGFSSAAQTYERGRPEYPGALSQWLRRQLGIAEGGTALDLGAGTGKFTRLLASMPGQVIAVEPVDEMRAQLEVRLPLVRALAGSAEAIPLADGAVDVVVCAQAFHWFASEDALREIHRVLKPGGRLGLVWNVRDDAQDWVAEIGRILAPYEAGVPRFHSGDWRRPFESGRHFSPLRLDALPHRHVGSARQVILDRFLSVSFIAALPPEPRREVASRLQALIDSHPGLQGREEISFPYRTEAYSCVRL